MPTDGAKRRGLLIFGAFVGVGFFAAMLITLTTGNMALGLLYGVLPGVGAGSALQMLLLRKNTRSAESDDQS